MYNDGQNAPTIGVGYAAVVKGTTGWAVKETLRQNFEAVGAPLNDSVFKTLGEEGCYHGLARAYFDPDMTHSTSVKNGDTLSAIAKRHGTTISALAKVNPHIESIHDIRPGDVLALPAGAKINGKFVYDGASAHRALGTNHTLVSGNYIGASQEFSPEDALTPAQNTKQLKARRAASRDAGGGSRVGNGSTGAANGERTESLYGPDTSGYVGTAGSHDTAGDYTSGTTRGGAPTGGSRLDAFGREVGAYGQFTRDIMGRTGSGPNGASSNTRVICTELVRQGRMAPSLQRLDIAFTLRELSPATVRGYHVWAVPYVRWMRRSKFATAFIQPIATWHALEIAHQLGERDTPHYRGKLVMLTMEPTCWLVGQAAAWLPGDPDRFHPYLQR